MNIFWTSDWHLNHFNIIKYTGRPFTSLEEMNSTIINRFNERVKEDDLVYFLGDFCFKSGTGRGEGEPDKAKKFKDRLNCKNIIWIGGNHDNNNSLKTPIQNIVIKYGGKRIFMVHNPDFCNINYDFNIVGHVHEKWQFKRYRKDFNFTDCCNVSVERWNYYPVTWNEINQAYALWLKQDYKNEKKN
jgi:calcineurin-like phosphoesterase family protein